MTALAAEVIPASQDPQIYLACPLTALSDSSRRQITSDVRAVKRAIEAVTFSERTEDERWPVVVYAPIDHTAPWKRDDFAAAHVYERNLNSLHASDALVVVAENGASAGVGQELEWAIRLGLPSLYLASCVPISRQIEGAPGFVQAQTYNNDAETLEKHVKNFLRQFKPLILDGPRRRESRVLRFEAITQRLNAAWKATPDPTGVAAQVRVHVRYLELTLSDPTLVSVMPTETLISLAHELDVPLLSQSPHRVAALPVPALRALLAAAEGSGWPDDEVEQLIYFGRAAMERGDQTDLATVAAWRQLHGSL